MTRAVTLSFLLILAVSCCISKAFSQAAISNQGKEFWTAYMAHREDNGASEMDLYITSDVNTSGLVESADGDFSIPFNVSAKQITIVKIPRSAFLPYAGQYLKGIHITSLNNVAIYAHIFAQSVSGATLLLPVNVLGKSYTSINYTQRSNAANSYSTFSVIATEDNTTVEITPSAPLVTGEQDGVPFQIHLKKGELYQGLSTIDLTNTTIRSISSTTGECKKVAVFSGSSKIGIGCYKPNNFSSDNLFQQVYPTSSWGKSYLTVPLKDRNYDVYRVIFSEPNTQVTINGQIVTGTQNASNLPYYEFNSQQPNVVTANKPIQVVQYAVTQGNHITDDCLFDINDVGDPEMIYLTPLEQTLDHVTLYSTSNFAITKNFINVVIKTSDAVSFRVDGAPYSSFTPVSGNPDYSYAQISVSSGTHYIYASGGFNAIAYGFGQKESYGYAAGASLQNLNEYIAIADKQTKEVKEAGCAGVNYSLQLTLPFQTTNIKWDLNDGSVPFVDANPVIKSTTQKNGVTLYLYEYNKTLNLPTGEYDITATVKNPVADDCGSNETIDFDLVIGDFPDVKFAVSSFCPGDSTVFTDKTDPKTSTIKSWLWDFGDGQTSTLQNPKHAYAAGGNYNVKLTVFNENGCSAVSNMPPITILQRPFAAFKASTPNCAGQNITFSDQSTSANGPIKQWIWDFGDSTAVDTRTNGQPFIHTFKKVGVDTVKLTVINEAGCTSNTLFQVINISPLPVVDFALPDVCLADAFAKFTDKSTVSDHTEGSFTYSWDFGDANATATNSNTSTLKNPVHKYIKAQSYIVTLTVTSASGCSVVKRQTLTVNGDIPAAVFSVNNKNALCSATPVTFVDQSTVNFGNITKIVWYYDYTNNPSIKEVYLRDSLPANRTYQHNYDVFNTPQTKIFTVRMEAYSGETCVDITQQDITINANPVVALAPVGALCYHDNPVQVLVNTNGFNGSGTFSGKGITANGIFTPALAGAGITTISYKFTALNGCDYTTTQDVKVFDELRVDAGTDETVLEGESVLLKASANQSGLTYKWLPATGLDHPDELKPLATPTADINYKLMITNADGCSATDDVFVHVLKVPVVVNTFTPNNDGINDTWNIKYLESYPGNTVDIYNRQGEKVYSSVGYAIPWDGRYKGADLPAGTYYYIINPKNGRKVIAGNVTILR